MKELTARQREILSFIDAFSAGNGMAPSVNELAGHFGIAPATVSGHLRALQKKYSITRSSKARSIVVADRDRSNVTLQVPVYGRLVNPVLEENRSFWEGVACIHRSVVGRGSGSGVFALRIQNESLRELGIFHHDIAIFSPVSELVPRFGDVVVFFYHGEALVRGYFPRNSGAAVALRAAHAGVPELELTPEEFKPLGVLIAIQRSYLR